MKTLYNSKKKNKDIVIATFENVKLNRIGGVPS